MNERKAPPNRCKIYYDAEFTGLHRNTTLISIGMYSQTGAYFYAEFTDYDTDQVSSWIQEHVIDNLMLKDEAPGHIEQGTGNVSDSYYALVKGTKSFVKEELCKWLESESKATGMKVQFYTDCYAYDWMLLNDLICDGGDALMLPEYVDYIPIDLSTMLMVKGIDPDITREEFAPSAAIQAALKLDPIASLGEGAKHNSLWDAAVAMMCFMKLLGS
jgi:hypothetical protein